MGLRPVHKYKILVSLHFLCLCAAFLPSSYYITSGIQHTFNHLYLCATIAFHFKTQFSLSLLFFFDHLFFPFTYFVLPFHIHLS